MAIRKPQSKYAEADEIYDSFEKKDMSRHQFRKEYLAAIDPTKLQRDLGETLRYRQNRRTQAMLAAEKKKKIDSAISEN